MAESHIVSGLVAKHSELAGLIRHHQNEINRIAADLNHLDATLKLFAPDMDLRRLRAKHIRKSNMGGFKYFKPGESHLLILDILREAGQPRLTTEIISRVIEKKELEDTRAVRETLLRTITGSLRRLEQREIVQGTANGKGRALSWELA